MKKENIKEILEKIGKGELTAEEEAKAKLWLFQLNQKEVSGLSQQQIESASREIWRRLDQPQKVVRVRRMWQTWGAVASIILILLAGSIFYINQPHGGEIHEVYGGDVAPGRDGATLTLSDGTTILISDALTGNIAEQFGVVISKDADGKILYEMTGESTGEVAYNTLETTRGEQIRMRLPDGTLVSLNAASSLRYPTSFASAETRTVILDGEGYFQVKKDHHKPFVVKTSQQQVEVLGTHFNVNTYDPSLSVTTLEEGSVRVSTTMANKVIRPGEQVLNNGTVLTIQPADLEQTLGWKDGNFVFMGADIKVVMGQLERWYDVEAVYEGSVVGGLFYANISRNRNISEILQVLEKTNSVTFKIQGRRIMVRK